MNKYTHLSIFVAIFVCILCFIEVESLTSPPPTTKPTPQQVCERQSNKSCDACISAAGAKCYYCTTTKACMLYPASQILPTHNCELKYARWGTCAINFEALIISMSVIAGLILIGVPCGIYCCCCRSSGNKAKWAREDAKTERQKEERKMKHEQKKAERKAKNDEIRRKYGLLKNEDESDSLYAEDV